MSEIQAVMTRVTRTAMVGEHLVRVSVAGPELWGLPWGQAGPGPRADAYFKVIIPAPGQPHVRVDTSDMSRWRQQFLSRPESERGWIRTYTLRDARIVPGEQGEVPEIDIDVVVHQDENTGEAGPGARWGFEAAVGDTVQLLVPSSTGTWWAGWDEERALRNLVVIAGDETALPAIAATVECLERSVPVRSDAPEAPGAPHTVHVAVEVPSPGDATVQAGPAALSRAHTVDRTQRVTLLGGTELIWTWLPRNGGTRNLALELWLGQRLGELPGVVNPAASADPEERGEPDDDVVWASAEPTGQGPYWFLAAESSAVKSLRRMCVSHGVQKTDISFMGYWKRGRATE